MSRRLLPLFLIVSLVPVPVFADLRDAVAPETKAPNALAEPGALLASALEAVAQAPQSAIEAAAARKNAGKRKMYIGLGTVGAGVLIAVLGTSTCSTEDIFSGDCRTQGVSKAPLIGGLVGAAGGGVFAWGLFQWYDANGELNRLAVQGPGTTAAIPLNEDWAVSVAAGTRPAASLAFSW